jgi:hypothetical protein
VPIIVSDRIGEPARVTGNGKMYRENDAADLAAVIRTFDGVGERLAYGAAGRRKMLDGFSWTSFARTVEADFAASLGR